MEKMDQRNYGNEGGGELSGLLMAQCVVAPKSKFPAITVIERFALVFALLITMLGASAPANAYCTASGMDSNYEWVDALGINGNTVITGNNGGYYLHPEVVLETPDISLELTPAFSGSLYPEYWGVWVDWNQDDLFTEAERVFSGQSFADETLPVSIPVPPDALIGPTRMRIIMRYGSDPLPCESFNYGEVEDVPLFVTVTGDAPPPVEYCTASGTDALSEWIDSVEINGLVLETGSNGGYLMHDPVVALETPNISLNLSPGFASVPNLENWVVWVDWNQDMVFDTTEQMYAGVDVAPVWASFDIPANALPGETLMRITMSPDAVPFACGEFPVGEVEDLRVFVPDTAISSYELSVDSDYTVYRNGPLNADVTWVVEKDGVITEYANGTYELSYRYGGLTEGSYLRIWLEEAGQPVVAEPVEFVVGQTLNYQLSVDTEYNLIRSGVPGEPLTWVIEQDGIVVHEDDASAELFYKYFANTTGSLFRVWLASYGQRVSNVVEYMVDGNLNYELALDQSYRVVRTGNVGEPVQWRVIKDGMLQGFYDASFALQWIDYELVEGAIYEVTLTAKDPLQTQVSNTVQFMVGDLPTTHTLSYVDGMLVRSGTLGEPLILVIEEEGRVVFEQEASSELHYYPSIVPGVNYRFWLEAFVDGGYQRVSNIVVTDGVQEPLPDPVFAYELSLGSDYTVYRNGLLDAPVTWVVEKDGVIVLSANGAYMLSYHHGDLTEGSHYRIWLEEGGLPASDVVDFTFGETLNYMLSVDTGYQLTRSGLLGEPLTWVIEQDGTIVLERDASTELNYTYFSNMPGSHFRVWVALYGQRVSNVVEYLVDGTLNYELVLDTSHRVVRTGNIGEPLLWRVDKDGMLLGFSDASLDLQWIDYEHTDGSTYVITLVTDDSSQTPVSNSVQYMVDDLPLTHTVSYLDWALTRDGTTAEPIMYWVIEEEGRVVLEQYASNELQYYPTLDPGLRYRFWLKGFVGNGYQRISNIVIHQADSPAPPPNMSYELSLGSDYTVYRNGDLNAPVTWVVEKDGEIVAGMNGTYELSYRYWNLTEGSHFRVWLEESGQVASEVVEFTVGQTLNYELSVDSAYHLSRSGLIGEPLTWVIEQDGGIVLERDASAEFDYTYFANTTGSHFRVWLASYGQRVSNVVEYMVDANLNYELTLDLSHRVVRTGNTGEPLLWRVDKDGMLLGFSDAGPDLQWIDYEHSDGATYAVTLVTNDALQTPVSNTVQYTVDDIPLTHALSFANGLLTRSGTIGESVTWVIEENGRVVLERYASEELEYAPFMYTPGNQYRFWLESFIDGGYQRVSNIVTE